MKLSLTGIEFSYGKRQVLAGITTERPLEGVVALLGPNGSGKSTLLKCTAGILPRRGEVTAEDAGQVLSARAAARETAYVPQDSPGAVQLTVMEATLLGLRRRAGWRTRASEVETVLECLGELGIAHLSDRLLTELSGGQRQLAGLAQMTVRSPRILLLDEPTSALDLRHQVQVLDFIRRRTERTGGVSLVAIHDLNLAARFCDRILMLSGGVCSVDGTPTEVLTKESLAGCYRVEASVLDDDGVPVVSPTGQAETPG